MTKSDTLDVKQGARTRGKIRRNAQETRERLLQAATQEFSERGYDGARMERIVRAADCNVRMVYHYFDSKAQLFFEIHHRAMDALFEELEPVVGSDLPAPERFTEMARCYVRTLIRTQPYQRTVSEAVQMLLRSSTTEAPVSYTHLTLPTICSV